MAFDGRAMGKEMVEAVRSFVTRSLDPIKENVGGLVQRLDKHFQQMESLERRASRHADHLAALETRLKRLEHGGDK